jgi:alginate O-acetyltransferase complex protein AlgI
MLAIIVVLLYGMKGIIAVEARFDGIQLPTFGRWLEFAALWPGMRPAPFAAPRKRLDGGRALLNRGGLFILCGLLLSILAWFVWRLGRPVLGDDAACVIATLLSLPGLSMMLHFGAFNVLAGGWRLAGVDVRPLFRSPLASRSLDAFWSRRWNLAFSEMIALGVYRPLAGMWGRSVATVAAFLASGVLHELAISVPVKSGYGGPMLYFLIQGVLILIERRFETSGRPVSSWGAGSHVWVLLCLALPAPILFHHAFLDGTIWPLIGLS